MAALLETIVAVNWLVAPRLKRNFGVAATASADSREHLAAIAVFIELSFLGGAASRTTLRLSKAFLVVEFLLLGGPDEIARSGLGILVVHWIFALESNVLIIHLSIGSPAFHWQIFLTC